MRGGKDGFSNHRLGEKTYRASIDRVDCKYIMSHCLTHDETDEMMKATFVSGDTNTESTTNKDIYVS